MGPTFKKAEHIAVTLFQGSQIKHIIDRSAFSELSGEQLLKLSNDVFKLFIF